MAELLKFLVVDDDIAIRTSLSDVMKAKNYEVVAVGTGAEAIEKVKEQEFHVAIIDIRLPDVKGTDVLKKIKEINHNINCLIITAYPEEDPAKTIDQGAVDFFIKPIDLDRMLEIIRKMHA